jgi:hypothetical protein
MRGHGLEVLPVIRPDRLKTCSKNLSQRGEPRVACDLPPSDRTAWLARLDPFDTRAGWLPSVLNDDLKAGLDTALNEATLLGVELPPDRGVVAVTFSVLSLPPDGGPMPEDPRVQLVFWPVGRLAVSYRGGPWNDPDAPVLAVNLADLPDIAQSFGPMPIYGRDFFDADERELAAGDERLSLDVRAIPEDGAKHSFTFSLDGAARYLAVRIGFAWMEARRPDGMAFPLADLAAGGQRWWEAFQRADPRTQDVDMIPLPGGGYARQTLDGPRPDWGVLPLPDPLVMPGFDDDPKWRVQEEKVVADVLVGGAHVINIVINIAADDEHSGWSYTIGLFRTFGHPELIIVGESIDFRVTGLRLLVREIQEGWRLEAGQVARHSEGAFDGMFRDVQPRLHQAYLSWATWFYDSRPFPVLQFVYPDAEGRWPWDPAASEEFRRQQPDLATAPVEWNPFPGASASLPESEAGGPRLSYPYRQSLRTTALLVLFFGACALVSRHAALTSGGVMAILLWGVALAGAAFVVGAVLTFGIGLRGSRAVTLTDREISAPKSRLSREVVVVPLSEIRSVGIQTVQKQRFLSVEHSRGTLAIAESYLPDGAFDELLASLHARLYGAGS